MKRHKISAHLENFYSPFPILTNKIVLAGSESEPVSLSKSKKKPFIVVQSGEVKISIEDGNYFQMSKIVKEGEVIYSKLAVINYMLNFKSMFFIFFMGSQHPVLNSETISTSLFLVQEVLDWESKWTKITVALSILPKKIIYRFPFLKQNNKCCGGKKLQFRDSKLVAEIPWTK